jgi:nucleoside-diphosphate-sugar epimerase
MADHYLVTGGMGFIGSHIVRRLVGEGARVRVVDDLSTGSTERLRDLHGAFEFVEGDLAEERVCEQVTRGIVYVLHQAAIPSVQRSVSDPVRTNRANVTATLNLLEACRKAGVKRIVCAASSSAYGDTAVLPKVETMPPDPLSPYALQKLVGERYCKLYYRLYGLETVCLRYFNVFGPSQDPFSEYSAVIPRFTTALMQHKPITIFGDGEQSRDFTYVENVVEANLRALQGRAAAGQVANIGCGERITLNELVRRLEELTGIKANVIYASPKSGDVRDSLADISLARELFGYQPKVMIMEGLTRTVESMKLVKGNVAA